MTSERFLVYGMRILLFFFVLGLCFGQQPVEKTPDEKAKLFFTKMVEADFLVFNSKIPVVMDNDQLTTDTKYSMMRDWSTKIGAGITASDVWIESDKDFRLVLFKASVLTNDELTSRSLTALQNQKLAIDSLASQLEGGP